MRYPNRNISTSRNEFSQNKKWSIIVICIIIAIFFIKGFFVQTTSHDLSSSFTISGSGEAIIIDNSGKKQDIETTGYFTSKDSMLSVLTGILELHHTVSDIWLDKGANISAKNISNSGIDLTIMQGRAWTESRGLVRIQLKHALAQLGENTVGLLEQQKIHSIIYALKGDITIEIGGGKSYILKAGKKIMLSQSDIVNPNLELDTLTESIDDNIRKIPLFIERSGEKLLGNIQSSSGILDSMTGTGGSILILNSGSLERSTIEITSPNDGAIIDKEIITVEGRKLSDKITRLTINNKEVALGNQGIWSVNLNIETDPYDIIYKTFDINNALLERGIITVYSTKKKVSGTDTLIPTIFPTSDANYKITSPTENPFKTNQNAITVSGTVPRNKVSYITVNGFRLKKFIPNSTTWYYYANTAYGTMKEGFNLYEIKFFDANNEMLSNQLFTIIKESNNTTLSGE